MKGFTDAPRETPLPNLLHPQCGGSGAVRSLRCGKEICSGIYVDTGLRQILRIVSTPTLVKKLGTNPHASPLLQKAKHLGLDSAAKLESLGVARGCWHYRCPGLAPAPDVSQSEFNNEELAVTLLSTMLPYSPHTIRVGAAMLGATGNDVELVVRLVMAEGCVAPVRYIANAGLRFEPDNLFWRQLLDGSPETPPIPGGVMPHPTRFVSMTGMTRAGMRPVTIWIRPRPDLALAHG